MKKRILGFLLSLCMVLALTPATVFGEDLIWNITYEFTHGALPNSSPSPANSTVNDGEFIAFPGLKDCGSYRFLGWQIKGSEDTRLYGQGESYKPVKDTTFVAVYDEIMTLTVPFTTTVKQAGNVAPGETVFNLQVIGSDGDKISSGDVEIEADSVTTNGAGTYTGTVTIKGTYEDIRLLLSDKVFIKQADVDDPNWTVDDQVWGLMMTEMAALAVSDNPDGATEYSVLVFPAEYYETEDGGYYEMVDGAYAVDNMSFTNIYTKSVTDTSDGSGSGTDTTTPTDPTTPSNPSKPAQTNPDTGVTSPQTGDNSHMALWITLLAASVFGIVGSTVYRRRKRVR